MLSLAAGLFSKAVFGGITGLLGALITKWSEIKSKKMDCDLAVKRMEHEIALKKADAEIMQKEWESREAIAGLEAQGAESVADAEALSHSHRDGLQYSANIKPTKGQGWALVSLDIIRGLVRPAITLYLCVLTTLIYLQAREMLGSGYMTKDQAFMITNDVVGGILYLTMTTVLWWFGTRSKILPNTLQQGSKS